MTTLEILKAARERISDPKRWTQGSYARFNGKPCCIYDAECWCAQGALVYACGSYFDGQRTCAADALVGPERSLAVYNDTHTHAEVLDLFDRTIARLEET